MCLWQVPFSFLLSFSFSSDHPFCRATFLKCWVRVVPDVWTLRGPSTRSCLLYSHWSSWLFTGKQNDPRGTRDVLPMDRPPLACVWVTHFNSYRLKTQWPHSTPQVNLDEPRPAGETSISPIYRPFSVSLKSQIWEDILIFIIKTWLQFLPTKYNLATCYPSKHDKYCILHPTQQDIESTAHILNGCNYYIVARHDRDIKFYKHSTVKNKLFPS